MNSFHHTVSTQSSSDPLGEATAADVLERGERTPFCGSGSPRSASHQDHPPARVRDRRRHRPCRRQRGRR